jgi:diguanylate cyclase (GGDEF)-like protein/PAS domain S-box-containing protein
MIFPIAAPCWDSVLILKGFCHGLLEWTLNVAVSGHSAFAAVVCQYCLRNCFETLVVRRYWPAMLRQRDILSGESKPSILVSMGLVEPPTGQHPTWLVRALDTISVMWSLVVLSRLAVIMALSGSAVIGWITSAGAVALLITILVLLIDLSIIVVPRLGAFLRRPPHIQLRAVIPLIMLSGWLYALAAREALLDGTGANMQALLICVVLPALVAVSIFGGQRVLGFIYCAASVGPFLFNLPPTVPVSVPLSGLAGLLLAAMAQARADQQNLQRKLENSLRGEQAQALITDFEEAGQGWFWETDRHGHLTYVSSTLARKVGKTADELLGAPITVLIEKPLGKTQGEGGRTVGFHLSARSAFSEIAVRAAISGEECWWSISGRPVVNEFGQFLGFRGSGADLTEMRKSQAEVSRLAKFDSLTGLANRVQMMATLEQLLVDPAGLHGSCALLILDLDRFKGVNDTMGHPAGDALLRLVAQRLLRVVGSAGKVGRLGGDEFQVLLPGVTDRAELSKLSEMIIHSVSQPYALEGAQVVIGVSVGIALAPYDATNPDTLIRNADLALYKAKDSGRGAFRFYSQDMHADAEDRRQLEQDLRHAISTGGLHVEYQAVVSSSTERITGFETLVRWTHPARGAISPAYFIPIAEEAGLICQIGEWVLRTACNDAIGWPEGVRVAVNVSPIQFGNPAFPTLVMNALAKSGLDPERLELEITESVFIDDSGDTDAIFAKLKALGVRLALDDFGTGYSALGYLKTAPFDKIKIDQSFVRGAAVKGSRNGAIVQSIVSLADALSMETTAEGAETLDELELIRSLGCSHVQGYVYGRPSSNDLVMARFAEGELYARPTGFKASRETRRTMLRTVVLTHGGEEYEARIRNISSGGAMIEGLGEVPPGTMVQIAFSSSYAVEGCCRWSSGERLGIEFTQPLAPHQVHATDTRPPRPQKAADAAQRKAG